MGIGREDYQEMGYAGYDEYHCTHPEVKLGKYLLNKDVQPDKMYCLACGEEVYE